MSLHTISHRLAVAGIDHVVISADTTPEGFDDALESFKSKLEDMIEKYNKAAGNTLYLGSKITSENGKRYTKVFVIEPQGNRRIYCFVDRGTGDILKPATFNTPAKGARGNIFDDHNGMKRMGPYGPAYNK